MNNYRIVCVGAGDMFQYCVRSIMKEAHIVIPAIFTWSESAAHKISRYVLMDPFAKEMGIPLIKVQSMNDTASIQKLIELDPDIVFVDGWSEKLMPPVLEAVNNNFICIHPSILPKGRGGATLNWAIINGEKTWGITLFYMVDEIDAGDIVDQQPFFIEERDDIQTVFDKAAMAAVKLLSRAIPLLRDGHAARIPQNHSEKTFFSRRKPEQGEIDWTSSKEDIYNFIRALTRPYPGAFFHHAGKKVTVLKASILNAEIDALDKQLGKIIDVLPGKGVVMSCVDGTIIVERIQIEGQPASWADEWYIENIKNKDS